MSEKTGGPKKATRARKVPRQQRSAETVAAIVEATERVLTDIGFDELTTNRVAKVAGVSVGSLYQYFPNREALVAAVIDRRARDTEQRLMETLRELQGKSLEQAIRALAEFYVGRYQTDRDFYKAVIPHLAKVDKYHNVEAQAVSAAKLLRYGLEIHTEKLKVKNLDVAAFLLVSAAVGVMSSAVTTREDLLDSDALVDELALLVSSYLLKPAPPG